MTDPWFERLATLQQAEPETARTRRVQRRCHAQLARQRARRARQSARDRRYWVPLLTGLGGIYLAETVRQLLDAWGTL